MISSGESSMPPSIGLKMSAVICGKSAVVFPAAFASSMGSFFQQPVKANNAHPMTQDPIRARRRTPALTGSSTVTEPLLICWSVALWQETLDAEVEPRFFVH